MRRQDQEPQSWPARKKPNRLTDLSGGLERDLNPTEGYLSRMFDLFLMVFSH